MTLAELVVILCAIRGIAKGGNGDASSGVRSPRKSDAATEMQRNGILVMKAYFNDLVSDRAAQDPHYQSHSASGGYDVVGAGDDRNRRSRHTVISPPTPMPTNNLRLHSPNCISVSVLFDATELSAATVFSSDRFSASLASRFYTALDDDASSVPAASLAFFFLFVTPALPLSFQGAAGGRGVVERRIERCLEKVKAVQGCRCRRYLLAGFFNVGRKIVQTTNSHRFHRRLRDKQQI
jgi:hypothetical protein